MSQPTFAVAVRFEIKPEHLEDFYAAVQRQAFNSLSRESACHQFDVCLDADDRSRLFLYETYDDAAAFAAHRQTPHFADFDATVRPWIADKQVSTWTITSPLQR